MWRVVLDTCVLTAGLRSRHGASNALLKLVATERLRPLCTTALYLEYEAVLLRPEQRLEHGLGPVQVEHFLAAFAAAAEGVEVHLRWRPQLGDPSDEMVLEAVVNGQADALVTHNVRDFAKAVARFGLAVKRPGEILKEMRS